MSSVLDGFPDRHFGPSRTLKHPCILRSCRPRLCLTRRLWHTPHRRRSLTYRHTGLVMDIGHHIGDAATKKQDNLSLVSFSPAERFGVKIC